MEHHHTGDLTLIILENNHSALRLKSFNERISELEIGFVIGSCCVEDLAIFARRSGNFSFLESGVNANSVCGSS